MSSERGKTLEAVVLSRMGAKSLRVAIDYTVRHPRYGKYTKKRTKLSVHDEHNQGGVGDVVEIAECKPCSRTKSWRLVKVLHKATVEQV